MREKRTRRVTIECNYCRKWFVVPRYKTNRKFCSQTCANRFTAGKYRDPYIIRAH